MKIWILFLIPVLSLAQPAKRNKKAHKHFLLQVDTLNNLLAAYDTLYPHSSNLDEFERIESIGFEINQRLPVILEHPLLSYYKVDKLIHEKGLSINTSKDNKLYFFMVDQKTGGSYHPYDSYLYYRFDENRSGMVMLGEPFFSVIGIVDSTNSVYLISSHLFGCNTCVQESVIQLSPNTLGGVNMESIYYFEGRDISDYQYDSKNKVLTYQNEDPFEDDSLYWDEGEYPDGRFRHEGTMVYRNGKFVTTQLCDFLIQEASTE
tara:strand:+ start:109 stop:894 length:786 start_codon:yes stop_codon:yes gene_type:complete